MSEGLLLLRSPGGGPLTAYRWPSGADVPAGAWHVPREHIRRVLADEFGERQAPVIIGPTAAVRRLTRERDELAKTLGESFDVLNNCHDIIAADCDEATDRWLMCHLELVKAVLDEEPRDE